MLHQTITTATAGWNLSGLGGDLAGIGVLVLAGVAVLLTGHGYANTVKSVALCLYRHADATEKRHERRARKVSEDWVRVLEGEGGPVSNNLQVNLQAIFPSDIVYDNPWGLPPSPTVTGKIKD